MATMSKNIDPNILDFLFAFYELLSGMYLFLVWNFVIDEVI